MTELQKFLSVHPNVRAEFSPSGVALTWTEAGAGLRIIFIQKELLEIFEAQSAVC